MTKAGDVGRDGENKVRDYLIEQGYEYAKRIRLKGQYDEGDVVLGDGYQWPSRSRPGRVR